MMDNDDIYKHFDEPTDDDKDFVNLTEGLTIDRMYQFMKDNLSSFTSTLLEPKFSMRMFPMDKRYMLIKVNFKSNTRIFNMFSHITSQSCVKSRLNYS